jgi:DivIVA domain-containing protein
VGTLLIYGLIAIVFAVAIFLLATYFLPAGEQIAPSVRDEPIWSLPTGHELRADDVADVRLPVALRGYRFAETDLLLDRLAEELKSRDAEIARLRGHRPSPKGAPVDHTAAAEVVIDPAAEAADSGD